MLTLDKTNIVAQAIITALVITKISLDLLHRQYHVERCVYSVYNFLNQCDGELFRNLLIQNNVGLLQLRITTPSMVLEIDDGSVG